jgi:hypothetical protein
LKFPSKVKDSANSGFVPLFNCDMPDKMQFEGTGGIGGDGGVGGDGLLSPPDLLQLVKRTAKKQHKKI